MGRRGSQCRSTRGRILVVSGYSARGTRVVMGRYIQVAYRSYGGQRLPLRVNDYGRSDRMRMHAARPGDQIAVFIARPAGQSLPARVYRPGGGKKPCQKQVPRALPLGHAASRLCAVCSRAGPDTGPVWRVHWTRGKAVHACIPNGAAVHVCAMQNTPAFATGVSHQDQWFAICAGLASARSHSGGASGGCRRIGCR